MKVRKTVSNILICVFAIGTIGFSPITWLVHKCSHKKYGRTYNSVRAKFGIPYIESNFVVTEERTDAVFWLGNEYAKGHKRKTVAFSGFNILSEQDVYNLSKNAGKRRWLYIDNVFINDSTLASTTYTYQIESSLIKFTLQAADSLLQAEGIKLKITQQNDTHGNKID
jgi:hypothetical protein